MKQLEKLARKDLGEILIAEGIISKDVLRQAEKQQTATSEPLSVILVDMGVVDDRDLARVMADQFQLPFIDLARLNSNSEVEGLLPRAELVRRRVVPIDRLGTILNLAVAEMPEFDFLQSIQRKTRLTPSLFVTQLGTINQKYAEDLKQTPQSEAHSIREESGVGVDLEMIGEPEDDGAWEIDAQEGDWAEVFDVGNESVLKEMDRE